MGTWKWKWVVRRAMCGHYWHWHWQWHWKHWGRHCTALLGPLRRLDWVHKSHPSSPAGMGCMCACAFLELTLTLLYRRLPTKLNCDLLFLTRLLLSTSPLHLPSLSCPLLNHLNLTTISTALPPISTSSRSILRQYLREAESPQPPFHPSRATPPTPATVSLAHLRL